MLLAVIGPTRDKCLGMLTLGMLEHRHIGDELAQQIASAPGVTISISDTEEIGVVVSVESSTFELQPPEESLKSLKHFRAGSLQYSSSHPEHGAALVTT